MKQCLWSLPPAHWCQGPGPIDDAFVCKRLDPLFSGQNQDQIEKQKEAVKKSVGQ